MAHLVRHPRLQPFQLAAGGQFGLDPAYVPMRLLGRGGCGRGGAWAVLGRLEASTPHTHPAPRCRP